MQDKTYDILQHTELFVGDEWGNPRLPSPAAKLLLARFGTILFSHDVIYFDGAGGPTRMYNVLRLLCHDIPTQIHAQQVHTLRDYQTGMGFDLLKERAFPLSPIAGQSIALDAESGTILLCADEESCAVHLYVTAWHTAPQRAHAALEQMRSYMRTWIMQRTFRCAAVKFSLRESEIQLRCVKYLLRKCEVCPSAMGKCYMVGIRVYPS